jgi:Caspase domain/Cullin family
LLQQNNNVYDVNDLGLNLFRDNVVHDERIRDRLKRTLKEMIQEGRRGEAIDTIEVHNASQMLSRLGSDLYQEIFSDIVEISYLMTAYPRGFCIIITNSEFTNASLQREGANEDANLLSALFKDMNFEVIKYSNLTCCDMKSELEAFASHADLKNHSALIVIISSHGRSKGVLGIDENVLPFVDVRNIFNNLNCASLISEPKMIFFCCCRGGNKDLGVKINVNAMEKSVSSRFSFVDSIRDDSDGSSSNISTVSDMVFIWIQKIYKFIIFLI